MIALDTYIVVRFLVNDDKSQAQVAYSLLASQPVSISIAVLMETEWVLRKTYGFSKTQILGAISKLLGLEKLTVTEPLLAQRVLVLFAAGLGFSDAIHLAQAQTAKGFATFDRDVVKRAKNLEYPIPVFGPKMHAEGQ